MSLKKTVITILLITAVFSFAYGFMASLGDAFDVPIDDTTSGRIIANTTEVQDDLNRSYNSLQQEDLTSISGFFTGVNALVSISRTLIKVPFTILNNIITIVSEATLLPAWLVSFITTALIVAVLFGLFGVFSGRAER